MAKFEIIDNATGRTFVIEGDQPPSQAEAQELIQTEKNKDELEPIFDPFVAAKGIGEGLRRAGEGFQQLFQRADKNQAASGGGGFLGFDPGNVLGDPEIQAQQISEAEQKEIELQKAVLARRKKFDETQAGKSVTGKLSTIIGEALPTVAVPGGVAGGLLRRIGTSALSGGAIGATQFTENRGEAAAGGAAAGAGTTGVIGTIAKGVKGGKALVGFLAPFFGKKNAELIKKVGGDELLRSTLKKVEAGKRLGLDLTPAEATGKKQLAEIQGRVGRSPEGSKVIEKFGTKREAQGQSAIRQFLFNVSPEGSSANESIRRSAQKMVGDEIHAMQKAAKPFYEKARRDAIPEENLQQLMQDPVIKKGYDDIFRDVTSLKESKDVDLNSIQMLDLAKKNIDQDINREVTSRAPNAFRIKVLTESKQDLLNVADTFSPNYAEARGIYEAGSPAIEKLQGSVVGRIANMSDDRIKNVSKTLFDTTQTDVKVLRKMARRFSNEDPDAWRQVMRNEMERRLEQIGAERTPSSFFDQILKKDRDFKLFMTAAEGMPGVRKALVDMRRVFKDLIPPKVSVKASAFRAGEGLSEARSETQARLRLLKEFGLDKRDKSIAEIITNPRWHDELSNVLKTKKKADRLPKIQALFSKVAAGIGARQAAPPGTIELREEQ